MTSPTYRSTTAPTVFSGTTTPSVDQPADSQIDDLLLFVMISNKTAAQTSVNANYTEIQEQDVSSLSVVAAWRKAAAAGTQTHQPWTLSSAGGGFVHCINITKDTFDPTTPIAGSAKATVASSAPPDPPNVGGLSSKDYLAVAVGMWFLSAGADVNITPPTGYTEIAEVAGSSTSHLSTAYKAFTGTAEDPGAFGDDTAIVTNTGAITIIVAPVLTPKTIAVAQATETDTAQPISKKKLKGFAQTTETDTAQAIAEAKARSIGQVTETDVANPMTVSVTDALAQVTETDTANPMGRSKGKVIGQVVEVDEAMSIDRVFSVLIGQAVEVDVAFPMLIYRPNWILTPPTVLDVPSVLPNRDPLQREDPLARRLFSHYGMRVASGITLIKNDDDSYTELQYPTHDELMAAKQGHWPSGEKGPIYYLGGHIYEITSEERADLVAAGYAAYITGGTV